eukprot:4582075-Amphidinium_carterae.1
MTERLENVHNESINWTLYGKMWQSTEPIQIFPVPKRMRTTQSVEADLPTPTDPHNKNELHDCDNPCFQHTLTSIAVTTHDRSKSSHACQPTKHIRKYSNTISDNCVSAKNILGLALKSPPCAPQAADAAQSSHCRPDPQADDSAQGPGSMVAVLATATPVPPLSA